MKVYIGPYRDDYIPVRRWINNYCTWRSIDDWDDEVMNNLNFIDKSIISCLEFIAEKVKKINNLSYGKSRKVKVNIDHYDVWSADHTLALIILPVLKKLKEVKHGSPNVDDEDVPEELRSTSAPKLTEEEINYGTVDDNYHKRWNYVLDQMIWSFEQIVHDYNGEEQYIHKSGIDIKGMENYYNKIKKGTTLFGKYYGGLWD